MANENIVTDSEIKRLSEIIARGAVEAAAEYVKLNPKASVQDVSTIMARVAANTLSYIGVIGK